MSGASAAAQTTTTSGSSGTTGITRPRLAVRNLHTVGADGSVTYGWNQLVGTAAVDGQPVGVELLGNVSFVKGSGPIVGPVTYTFAGGPTLGVQCQGAATATSNGDATGPGIFPGSRKAVLGTTVSSTFDLTVSRAS